MKNIELLVPRLKGLFSGILLFASLGLMAQDELGVYEKLDEFIHDDIVFTDEKFQQVNIKDAIQMPTVIAMVYYECPGICTPLMNGLSDVINKSDLVLNKDYQIFTISFSHNEKTVLAQNKKKTYANLVQHGDAENGWRFFTGDSLTIHRFLDNIGYQVKQEGNEFIHPSTLLVVSPGGKITRYLHGTYILPFDFKMAIVEAGLEKSGPTINKVLNFCFSYDAEGKKYVLNVTKLSGIIILLAALLLFAFLIRSGNKKRNPNSISS
jgi:protein SCO1/2